MENLNVEEIELEDVTSTEDVGPGVPLQSTSVQPEPPVQTEETVEVAEESLAEVVEKAAEEEQPIVNVTSIQLDNGEDLLLAQIDAFREKAAQLSKLIVAKEQQAAELEAIVQEKEAINLQLQEELSRKQEEADGLVADVETQVDRMMQVVKNNMDQLESDIKEQVSDNKESYEAHNKNLQDTLRNVSEGLDNIQNELSEKTHSESVHLYRLIQDLLQEHDNSEEQAGKAAEHYNALRKLSVTAIVLVAISLGISVASFVVSLGLF
jgi:deoxyribodipyrimidine photolyase